jgi:hypothetical protein
MHRESSSRIAVLLLDTLRKLECEPDTSRDDPAVASLERYVVRLVGELDAMKSDGDRLSAIPAPPPSPSARIVEILHNTLVRMGQMSDHHPEIGDLKDNILRAIVELEANQSMSPQPPKTRLASPAPADSRYVRCYRDAPPPGEAAAKRPAEPVLLGEKKKNRQKKGELTSDAMAPRSSSGGAC